MAHSLSRQENWAGYLCALPWFLGLLLFVGGPIIASFILSFCEWNILSPPKWVGLSQYAKLLSDDPLFIQSLKVTFIYTLFAVPMGMALALALALALNRNLPGRSLLRTIYFLPSVLSGVAVSMLWLWLFNAEYGLINTVLRMAHLPAPGWLSSEFWALPAIIVMSLWGVGGSMIIYLAGLQNIPVQLYESAEIDGGTAWQKFRNITLPMLSPVLFFTLITGTIGSFQVFTQAYVMTNGGPDYATYFYALYLYVQAFDYLNMGFASAMAWVLFVIILILTIIQIILSKRWVYYEEDDG